MGDGIPTMEDRDGFFRVAPVSAHEKGANRDGGLVPGRQMQQQHLCWRTRFCFGSSDEVHQPLLSRTGWWPLISVEVGGEKLLIVSPLAWGVGAHFKERASSGIDADNSLVA